MREYWTGEVCKMMHIYKIKQRDLAAEMGCSRQYVSAILRGVVHPENGRDIINDALEKAISKQKATEPPIYKKK